MPIITNITWGQDGEGITLKDTARIIKYTYRENRKRLNYDGETTYEIGTTSLKTVAELVAKDLPDEIEDANGVSWKQTIEEKKDAEAQAIIDHSNIESHPYDPMSDCKQNTELGWIVCPILVYATKAANSMYDDYIKPSLEISSSIFSGSDDSNARSAWSTFQNIANVLFVILLLVVIFSQLTGVGIDNYGIKKILPKLIIAIVLINLSYIICVICVDISNILGVSLHSIFDSLGANLKPMDMTIEGLNISGASIAGSTALTGVGTLAAIVGAGAAIFLNPFLLVSLLVSAIGIFITVFFLFVLLAARQAGVIVLVVISPVAFVCFILPNTQSIFKKWVKLFEGLLLVYPIAGLLVGGGNYVSRLLLSVGFGAGGFVQGFTAMIVGVVPIIFIPTVLKGSFAAMGNLGAKISGLGQHASRGATGAIRKTGTYRNLQQRGADRSGRIRAGIDSDGNERNLGRFATFVRGGRRSVAQARLQYNKTQNERLREQMLMEPGFMNFEQQHRQTALSNEREKMYSEQYATQDRATNLATLQTALAGRDAERASAAFKTLIDQGGVNDAYNALSAANWGTMDAGVENRLIRSMGSSSVDGMAAYSKYRQSGGQADFASWSDGSYLTTALGATEATNAAIRSRSFAQHLQEKGPHAMESYNRDEMQYVQANSTGIKRELGASIYGAMLGNAAVNSKDARAQTVTEQIITSEMGLATNNLTVNDLGITADMLGNMRDETATAIVTGAADHEIAIGAAANRTIANAMGQAAVRTGLTQQITDAGTDNRIRNKAKSGVRGVFGF